MGPVEILLGVTIPVLIGIGMTLATSQSSSKEFEWARLCFVSAGFMAIGLTTHWLANTQLRTELRLGIGFILGILVLTNTLGAVKWVNHRRRLVHPRREKLPGIGVHLVIKLNDIASGRRNYIFDTASRADGARVCLHISASDRFVAEVRDTRGETYQLEAPLGRGGVPIGEFMYLRLEIGVAGASTVMDFAVDGTEKVRRSLPFPIDLGKREWAKSDLTVGADAHGKNGASFDLAELLVYSLTFTDEDAAQMGAYIKSRYAIDVVA